MSGVRSPHHPPSKPCFYSHFCFALRMVSLVPVCAHCATDSAADTAFSCEHQFTSVSAPELGSRSAAVSPGLAAIAKCDLVRFRSLGRKAGYFASGQSCLIAFGGAVCKAEDQAGLSSNNCRSPVFVGKERHCRQNDYQSGCSKG